MKKSLLLGGACLLLAASAQQANAQAWSQDFNSGSLPSNWITINDANTPSSTTLSPATITKMTNAGWAISSTKGALSTGGTDYCAYSISSFTPAATADRWLITHSFTVSAGQYLTWEDFSIQSPSDSLEIWVSPTAGTTTASFTSNIYKGAAPDINTTRTYANQHLVSLGSFVGQNIRIAFREHTTNKLLLYIDNVAVKLVPAADIAITSISPSLNSPASFKKSGTSVTFTGTIKNSGSSAITSYSLNYRQGSNAVVTMPMSVNIAPLGTGTFTATTPYMVSVAGVYPFKVWVSLAGDTNPSNDTLTTTIVGVDSLQNRMVLLEEFNNASCDPCAAATPHLDSVVGYTAPYMNTVRYHWWFPGRDCMDSVTRANIVTPRFETYYGQNGVPASFMNGTYEYPGNTGTSSAPIYPLNANAVASEHAIGSPFKITPRATYNARTHMYAISADIKSFAAMPAGLVCQAVLTIDTITYRLNQSTENTPQTVFPQVVENMFGGVNGTALTSYTAGSTQTVNLTWTKDHPWGSDYSAWQYDSTLGGHVTFWVEDHTNKIVYQSASIPVSTVYTTGVPTVTGTKGTMSVYPNPAVNEASISLTLNNTANVSIQVYDIAGKTVFNTQPVKRFAGTSIIVIDASKLASGSYVVKAILDGEVITQKLTIAK